MTDGPFLWYLNRGTGVVLLVLLTASAVLGIAATRGAPGARVPRFAVQALHRNLALLGAVLTAVHVLAAVADEFVDIRWWQAFVPWRLAYEPFWLALGVLGLDLLLAVVVTSLVRDRLPRRGWLAVHLGAYTALVLSVAHGLGIGTDTGAGWVRWVYAGCCVALVAAACVRVVGVRGRARGLDLAGAPR